jgi:hypothetical protein
MTAALLRLAGDEALRRSFGAQARLRAAALSWDSSARSALGALREVAA